MPQKQAHSKRQLVKIVLKPLKSSFCDHSMKKCDHIWEFLYFSGWSGGPTQFSMTAKSVAFPETIASNRIQLSGVTTVPFSR
jgi:hypothetical protein